MRTHVAILIVALCCSVTPASTGQGVIVDQANDTPSPPPLEGKLIFVIGPGTGQEFRPTLNSLNFVDLLLGGSFSEPTEFGINIRSQTITGQIVGTSHPTIIPTATVATFLTEVHFDFLSPVSLSPGQTYVIEPIVISQHTALIGQMVNVPGYPAGRKIWQGLPVDNDDFFFREGVVVPEPSAVGLFGFALMAGFGARRFWICQAR